MISLPYPMIEFSNGILLILYFYLCAFAVMYLSSELKKKHKQFSGYGGWRRAWCAVYNDRKPAIAITVIFTGMFIRTLPLWYLRHALDHQIILPQLLLTPALPMLWSGTILTVLGVMCWIRVVSPFRNRNIMWTLMVVFAVAFAYYMAL